MIDQDKTSSTRVTIDSPIELKTSGGDKEPMWKSLLPLATPVVLGAVGLYIDSHQRDATLNKEYIAMAVDVLKQAPTASAASPAASIETELRQWALDVLKRDSPVPISNSLNSALAVGSVSFPTPAPPASTAAPVASDTSTITTDQHLFAAPSSVRASYASPFCRISAVTGLVHDCTWLSREDCTKANTLTDPAKGAYQCEPRPQRVYCFAAQSGLSHSFACLREKTNCEVYRESAKSWRYTSHVADHCDEVAFSSPDGGAP